MFYTLPSLSYSSPSLVSTISRHAILVSTISRHAILVSTISRQYNLSSVRSLVSTISRQYDLSSRNPRQYNTILVSAVPHPAGYLWLPGYLY